MRALLSVYDKSGLVELAQGLDQLGWELVASGNTSGVLAEAGIAHRQVAEVTGSPEMLGGRVKTLHPRIHGGILADRDRPEHLADLDANEIEPIDLVVCNLYPFSSDPSVELIDIGGPAMVRAAAKNFAHVGIVTSPRDYERVLAELAERGSLSSATRAALAREAFAHTAAYDAAIVAWLDDGGPGAAAAGGGAADAARPDAPGRAGGGDGDGVVDSDAGGEQERSRREELPPTLHLTLERVEILRYGENPHQQGARYRLAGNSNGNGNGNSSGNGNGNGNGRGAAGAGRASTSWWDGVTQHGGKALSYLNIFDADAAWRLVHELAADAGMAAVAIIKHANPCGAAVGAGLVDAYARALECDPQSAFGGIVAIGGTVGVAGAEAIAAGPQADVIVAAGYEPDALERLTAKRKATRLLSAPAPEPISTQVRSLGGSFLVQGADHFEVGRGDWEVVTKAVPTEQQWLDLVLAWRVCGRTTSNAVAVVNGGQAVGVGAGQQSRVVAAEIAVAKAGARAQGGAAASDAFFPFADGLEVLARAGVAAVVQPGGSVRDAEVVAAADDAGLAMVTTGERHFRH